MKLFVLLGGVVRVGDAAVDERGRTGYPAAFFDFGIVQDLQDPVHQPSSLRRSARASNSDFSAAEPSMASAVAMSAA